MMLVACKHRETEMTPNPRRSLATWLLTLLGVAATATTSIASAQQAEPKLTSAATVCAWMYDGMLRDTSIHCLPNSAKFASVADLYERGGYRIVATTVVTERSVERVLLFVERRDLK